MSTFIMVISFTAVLSVSQILFCYLVTAYFVLLYGFIFIEDASSLVLILAIFHNCRYLKKNEVPEIAHFSVR